METDLMGKNITISIGKFPVEARFGRQLGFLKLIFCFPRAIFGPLYNDTIMNPMIIKDFSSILTQRLPGALKQVNAITRFLVNFWSKLLPCSD